MRDISDALTIVIDSIKEVIGKVDKISDFSLLELYFKSVMATLAILINQDGNVSKLDYERYTSVCNKMDLKPFRAETISQLEDESVIDLFSQAIYEIKQTFNKKGIDFQGIEAPTKTIILGFTKLIDVNNDKKEELYEKLIKVFE